jgi:hypothetical protein
MRLQEIMDENGWNSRDVAALVAKAGLPIGDRAVDSWLGGRRLPKLKELEIVGRALGLADYRTELIPPPSGKSHGKPKPLPGK